VFQDLVKPDLEYMLRNFLAHRDRTLTWIAAVTVVLDE